MQILCPQFAQVSLARPTATSRPMTNKMSSLRNRAVDPKEVRLKSRSKFGNPFGAVRKGRENASAVFRSNPC